MAWQDHIIPTYFDSENPEFDIAYDGPNNQISTITMTLENGVVFIKTFTYTGNRVTNRTKWVKQS